MLFYLKYINHDVEKLQELLVYFFDKVEELSPTTFDRSALLPVWYSTATNIMEGLETRLTEFIQFDNAVKTRIIQAFREANEIELLFLDKNLNTPTKFNFDADFWKKVEKVENKKKVEIDIMISAFLKELFADFLYGRQLGDIANSVFFKIVKTNLSEHYEKFKKEANYEDLEYLVCPFCGLEKIRDEKNIQRPDYDHLLPKSEFVFSAVNMKNLIAAGDDCNSLKKTKSLLHTDQALQNRTLAFYPYSNPPHPFEQFTFKLICIRQSTKADKGEWQVEIIANNPSDTNLLEKIGTWNRVYKIKDRYAKFICDNHRNWIDGEFKITSINRIDDLNEVLNEQLNRLPYSYHFLATKIDVIPTRIFYQWALANESYLEQFIKATNVLDSTYSIDDYV